jgi:hypothetical protein
MAAGRSPLWPFLFGFDQQTFVVCAGSSLVAVQTILRKSALGFSIERYRQMLA